MGITSLSLGMPVSQSFILAIAFAVGMFTLCGFGGAALYTVRISVRLGVQGAKVMARRAGVDALEPDAFELMETRGFRTDFPIHFQPQRRWSAAVFRFFEHLFLTALSTLAGIVSLVSACGLVTALLSDGMGVIYPLTSVVISALVLVLGLRGLAGFEPPHLGKGATAVIEAAADGRPADALSTRLGGPIGLGASGTVVCGVTASKRTLIELRVPIWRENIDIGLVERGTVGQEEHDLDLGVDLFDRATIFLHHRPGATLPEAWLTDEIQTLMLVLFARGARVEAGELVLRIPLLRGFSRMPAALPFLGALSSLVGEQRALSEEDRIHNALVRCSDAQREMLLAKLGGLNAKATVRAIRQRWARQGQGKTRLIAATDLTGEARRAVLRFIALDILATSTLRGQAMGRLVHCGDDQLAWVQARLAEFAAEESCSGITTVLGLITEYEAHVGADGARIFSIVESTLPLRGVTGAALGYLLAINGFHRRDSPVERIRDAVLDPLESLSTDLGATVPFWELYGDVLDKLMKSALPEPLSHEIPAARREVRTLLESLAKSRQGGLSMTEADHGGELSLAAERRGIGLALAEPDETGKKSDA